ncbi:MAG: ABC transporter ATP-binding protein [Candidatus Xenobiia bacterium LiM19]
MADLNSPSLQEPSPLTVPLPLEEEEDIQTSQAGNDQVCEETPVDRERQQLHSKLRKTKQSSPGEITVSARGLVKRYANVCALSDVSFELFRGEIFGLVGPNGAGKTTLLRILATLLPHDGGTAEICGHPLVSVAKIRSIIGFMPDFLGVYDDMTVREYFEFFARAYEIAERLRSFAINDTLHTIGLAAMEDAVVEGLSRGMKQRLSLGRAILHKPALLLLDEPASGLDPLARLELREILRGLAKKGATILISSHVLEDLADICDRVGVISKGCIVYIEDTDRIISEKGGRQIRITTKERGDELFDALRRHEAVEGLRWDGDALVFHLQGSDDSDLTCLIKTLIDRDFPLLSFQEVKPTLETAYLNLTRTT